MIELKTINIKGKAYVPVNERVKAFREHFPNHTVITEIINLTPDSVVMKATVYDENGTVCAVGHAQEERNSSNINKTSYVENAETSAVGRALGMFGIGIDTSMASADEVVNAVERQETLAKKITSEQITALKMLADEKGIDFEKQILDYYKLSQADDMTMEQWLQMMRHLEKK